MYQTIAAIPVTPITCSDRNQSLPDGQGDEGETVLPEERAIAVRLS
jgi:hypothetical protein